MEFYFQGGLGLHEPVALDNLADGDLDMPFEHGLDPGEATEASGGWQSCCLFILESASGGWNVSEALYTRLTGW